MKAFICRSGCKGHHKNEKKDTVGVVLGTIMWQIWNDHHDYHPGAITYSRRTVMSFHYYSCRYLPPLPSTHVCLPWGLQWRLDKNSPKINHSISQSSENNCLNFHQISTLDLTRWLFGRWGERSIQTRQSLSDLSTTIENQETFCWMTKNAMWVLLLSSYNEDGPIWQNSCKQFGASGWAELLQLG